MNISAGWDAEDIRKVIADVSDAFLADAGDHFIGQMLSGSRIVAEPYHFKDMIGGPAFYDLYITISTEEFSAWENNIQYLEQKIKTAIEAALVQAESLQLSRICIVQAPPTTVNWDQMTDLYTPNELATELKCLTEMLMAVACGEQRINDINELYQLKYTRVNTALKRLNQPHPNPYIDLNQWRAKWEAGRMPQYSDRKTYAQGIYAQLLQQLNENIQTEAMDISVSMAGWERIEEQIKTVKAKLQQPANNKQQIGQLCRDVLHSLSRAIQTQKAHRVTSDGVITANRDAAGMLEDYLDRAVDANNEPLKLYARAAIGMANDVTRQKTMTEKEAALCVSATISLVNIIGTLEQRY